MRPKRRRVATGIYRYGDRGGYTIVYTQKLPDGSTRRVWRAGYATLDDARKARTKALADVDRGLRARPTRVTVGTFTADWLARNEAAVRANTHANRMWVYRNYIERGIGGAKLDALTPLSSQQFLDSIPFNAANIARTLMSMVYDEAVRMDVAPRNPFRLVGRRHGGEDRPQSTLTADELGAYLAQAPPILSWVALTGCRIGEARAARWQDISTDAAVWVIMATRGQSVGPRTGPPKTPSSRRAVPVTDRMRELLGERGEDTEFVFPSRSYTAIKGDHYAALTRAGVPRVRIHDLRHTWATLALQAGVHPKVVQAQLGHSTLAMTMDRYSHVLPEMSRAGAEAVDLAIGARAV